MATALVALGTQCGLCFLNFPSLSTCNALPQTIEISSFIFSPPLYSKCHHYHFNIGLCRFICDSFTFWARYKWDGWSNNPCDFCSSQLIFLVSHLFVESIVLQHLQESLHDFTHVHMPHLLKYFKNNLPSLRCSQHVAMSHMWHCIPFHVNTFLCAYRNGRRNFPLPSPLKMVEVRQQQLDKYLFEKIQWTWKHPQKTKKLKTNQTKPDV
jgi:hypothetical protein